MDSVAIPNLGASAHRSFRTPIRFRDRVILQFRSPQNLEYLRGLFARQVPSGKLRTFALETLRDSAFEFSSGSGRALEILASDSVAQRGALRPAVNFWDEIRRLNLEFYQDRLAFLREQAHLIDPRTPRDGVSEDDEPYHMRMFISDSLRPPGLEHLNSPGPHFALNEDQRTWGPARADDSDVFLYGEDDAPWSRGNPNRTAEQAVAEYWGDGEAEDYTVGHPRGRESGGTRFMRYESVPFWQRGGREGYEYDIEENLGTASREMDGHVRRWDMDRVRAPRGQEYRRYGPRTGHVV